MSTVSIVLFATFAIDQAMIQLKEGKGSRALMLNWIAKATSVNSSELSGILRWALTLKPGCLKHQVPAAQRVFEMLARPRGPH